MDRPKQFINSPNLAERRKALTLRRTIDTKEECPFCLIRFPPESLRIHLPKCKLRKQERIIEGTEEGKDQSSKVGEKEAKRKQTDLEIKNPIEILVTNEDVPVDLSLPADFSIPSEISPKISPRTPPSPEIESPIPIPGVGGEIDVREAEIQPSTSDLTDLTLPSDFSIPEEISPREQTGAGELFVEHPFDLSISPDFELPLDLSESHNPPPRSPPLQRPCPPDSPRSLSPPPRSVTKSPIPQNAAEHIDHLRQENQNLMKELQDMKARMSNEGRRSPLESKQVGNYKFGEQLGSGFSSKVYKGWNLTTGEFVAIKEVNRKNVGASQLPQIRREVELLLNLDPHANVVKFFEHFETEEYLYFILEYVEGGSLYKIMQNFGVFPENILAIYIVQVLTGLSYLHGKGVLHRDIKSDNLLLTKEGKVKLADFGSCSISERTTNSVQGSPFWMAPEVVEMKGATKASDIWSVGCSILELLTGKPPYWDVGPMSAMFAMVEGDKPPIPETISQEVRSFLDDCFIRDPDKRPEAEKLVTHPWLAKINNKEIERCALSAVGDTIKCFNQTLRQTAQGHFAEIRQGKYGTLERTESRVNMLKSVLPGVPESKIVSAVNEEDVQMKDLKMESSDSIGREEEKRGAKRGLFAAAAAVGVVLGNRGRAPSDGSPRPTFHSQRRNSRSSKSELSILPNLLTGHLVLFENIYKKGRRYWVLLTPTSLLVFKNEKSSSPKFSFPLTNLVEISSEVCEKYNNCFYFDFGTEKSRWFCSAASQYEQEQWMIMIDSAQNSKFDTSFSKTGNTKEELLERVFHKHFKAGSMSSPKSIKWTYEDWSGRVFCPTMEVKWDGKTLRFSDPSQEKMSGYCIWNGVWLAWVKENRHVLKFFWSGEEFSETNHRALNWRWTTSSVAQTMWTLEELGGFNRRWVTTDDLPPSLLMSLQVLDYAVSEKIV